MTTKKEREKIMSDADRIKAFKRKQARCQYCRGKNLIQTITDRLFVCCFECAGRDLTETRVFTFVPCISCGKKLKRSDWDDGPDITPQTAEGVNISGGTAARIDCGYGSRLDGNMYIVAVCDDCLKKAKVAKRITYLGNFISEI